MVGFKETAREELPFTATSCLPKFTDVKISVPFDGALIEKAPSAFVWAAILVPFTDTVTPCAGIPSFTFVTTPLITDCAKAVTEKNAKHSIMQILRICFRLIFIIVFRFWFGLNNHQSYANYSRRKYFALSKITKNYINANVCVKFFFEV